MLIFKAPKVKVFPVCAHIFFRFYVVVQKFIDMFELSRQFSDIIYQFFQKKINHSPDSVFNTIE